MVEILMWRNGTLSQFRCPVKRVHDVVAEIRKSFPPTLALNSGHLVQ
jgi:hypothetical protein